MTMTPQNNPTPEAREAAEQFRSVRVPEHRWDRDTRTHEMLERIIQEGITRATAAAQERIDSLTSELASEKQAWKDSVAQYERAAIEERAEADRLRTYEKLYNEQCKELSRTQQELETVKRERDEAVSHRQGLRDSIVIAQEAKNEEFALIRDELRARITTLERELAEARVHVKHLKEQNALLLSQADTIAAYQQRIAALEEDKRRLDWLEIQAKQSKTGISFDWCRYAEEGQVLEHGFRFMRRHFLGERKLTLRAAIDAALATQEDAR